MYSAFDLFQATRPQAKENVWEATCLPRQSAHVIEGTLVITVHASTEEGWEPSLLVVDSVQSFIGFPGSSEVGSRGLLALLHHQPIASSGSSASGSPHHHWASTVHGAEPRRQRRVPSPSRGSGRAGSAYRPRWGTHDAPETSEHVRQHIVHILGPTTVLWGLTCSQRQPSRIVEEHLVPAVLATQDHGHHVVKHRPGPARILREELVPR